MDPMDYCMLKGICQRKKEYSMVAERSLKLTNTELLHISQCHLCSAVQTPTLMKHLHKVASDNTVIFQN